MVLLVKSSTVRPPMAQSSGMERPLKRATRIAAIIVSQHTAISDLEMQQNVRLLAGAISQGR
jgi:hypothetical protein